MFACLHSLSFNIEKLPHPTQNQPSHILSPKISFSAKHLPPPITLKIKKNKKNYLTLLKNHPLHTPLLKISFSSQPPPPPVTIKSKLISKQAWKSTFPHSIEISISTQPAPTNTLKSKKTKNNFPTFLENHPSPPLKFPSLPNLFSPYYPEINKKNCPTLLKIPLHPPLPLKFPSLPNLPLPLLP